MILHNTSENIKAELLRLCPAAEVALERSRKIDAGLLPYQAMALYYLAVPFNKAGNTILEIGTAAGYSASILAQAAPEAKILTLNPRHWECETAKVNLEPYPNVQIIEDWSWEYFPRWDGGELAMIFVDGHHNKVKRDLPWFNRLKEGGLILFHDYGPIYYIPIYEAVNKLAASLGRGLDVMIMDTDTSSGMAGLVRRAREVYKGE